MKTHFFIFNVFATLIICSIIFFSCEDDNEKSIMQQGEVNFSFSKSENSSEGLKSANNKEDAIAVIVTIKDLAGKIVYDKKRLDLYNFNGDFISQSISLEIGDFQLTEFLVIDENNETIYTTPLEGSKYDYLVTDPLPIDFYVNKDNVTKIVPEVLSTSCICPAEDFGYSSFDFNVIEPLCFLMNVQVYNETTANWELTDAYVFVGGDSETIYSGAIEAKTDSVKVNDGFTEYKVSVYKNDFISKDTVLSKSELLTYSSKPLIFTLNKVETPTFEIGQEYGGGTIFWLDETKSHGLITTMSDMTAYWGCIGLNITSGNGAKSSTDGMANSEAIVTDCATPNIAAKKCLDYSVTVDGVVYDDWYLPAIKELLKMYDYRDMLGLYYTSSPFNSQYWSSTQINSTSVKTVNFYYNAPLNLQRYKANAYRFRPVRSF
jgi:hypothetical protein